MALDPGSQGLLEALGGLIRTLQALQGLEALASWDLDPIQHYPRITPGVILVTGPDRPKIRERDARSCPRGQLRDGPE